MSISTKISRFFVPVFVLLLVGCGTVELANLDTVVDEDLQEIYVDENVSVLTLERAIERALAYNLDARIAEQDYLVALGDSDLQKLNALPTITAKRQFMTRSNDPASSSVSVLTGTQSLEPSVSTDRSTWVNSLEANLDVLSSAISIYRHKSAVDRAAIAEERYRKVRQNIFVDVHSAFMRAAIAQRMSEPVEKALAVSEERLKILDAAKSSGDMSLDNISNMRAEILSKRKRIQEMYRGFSLADYELKALLSLPPETPLRLSTPKSWLSADKLPRLTKDIDEYVATALERRPEIREELLNLRVSQRNLNATVYETFPGLEILVSGNDSSNTFLQNERWLNLTATLSQSITRLLTLPARYEKAKREIDLADARRQALVAAVVSQVYIAKTLVDESYKDYNLQVKSFDNSKDKRARSKILRQNGLQGGIEEIVGYLDYQIAKAERYQSYSLANEAYTRLVSAVGYDVEDFLGVSVPDEHVKVENVKGGADG